MNEVHQLANALLTVVFAAAMFVVVHLYIEKTVYENSDYQPCRSGIRAMDEPSVKTLLLTKQLAATPLAWARLIPPKLLCIGNASPFRAGTFLR